MEKPKQGPYKENGTNSRYVKEQTDDIWGHMTYGTREKG